MEAQAHQTGQTRTIDLGITDLLQRWAHGDETAGGALFAMVYGELRRIARRYVPRGKSSSLHQTALVHEAYLRLVGGQPIEWESRAHFFSLMAAVMRRVMVDHVRWRCRAKRGGGAAQITLDEANLGELAFKPELLALDQALHDLAAVDPRKAKIVELRYFAGLSIDETARCLEVSPATVVREWRSARAWLHRDLQGAHHGT